MEGQGVFSDRSTLWVIHIGNDDALALRPRDEGFVCIGFGNFDAAPHDSRDRMRRAFEEANPDATPKQVSSMYGQVYRFAHEMQVGDPVIFPVRPTKEIAIGKVKSGYRHDPSAPMASTRLTIVPRTQFSQAALHSFGAFLTVSTSNDHLEEVIAVLEGKDFAPPAAALEEDEAESEYVALDEQAVQETEDYLLKAWRRTGAHFEQVVAAVFRAMGYTATVTQASGDHGVDVIAHPDPLGLEPPFVKVQAKSGVGGVGEPEVNQLRGLLNPGERGILVSLGHFTSGAQHVARASANLTLVDGPRFVELFLEHYEELDPTWRARYPLKRVYVPVPPKKDL